MPEGFDALDGLLIVVCLVLGFGVVRFILTQQARKPGAGGAAPDDKAPGDEGAGDDEAR